MEIFQPGYKVGERILRPARVAVAAPATGPDGSSNRRLAVRRRQQLNSPARPDEHEGLPEGLLQDAGRAQDRDGRRDQEVLPRARAEVPPDAREQGERGRRGALQGDHRSVQRAVRREAAQGVRRGALDVRRRFRVPTGTRAGAWRHAPSTLATCSAATALATCLAASSAAAAARRSSRARRGADVETETTLPFGDSIDGATVSLRLTGEGPCPVCHGTGAKAGTVPRSARTARAPGSSAGTLAASGSPSRARPAGAAAWWWTTRASPAAAAAGR